MTGTETTRLAQEYMRLGGTRLALIDDNKVSVRQWDDEPEAASAFWRENIECLDSERLRNVVLLLPAVSEEDAVEGRRH